MDGTLTVPCIDFAEMRRRVGATSPDILHEIDGWDEPRRVEAYRVIGEMEAEAKRRLQIMPGARELIAFLDARNIRRGLITRNVKDSVDHFHSSFEVILIHVKEFLVTSTGLITKNVKD
ncbi:unnamed protein product [Closterium sp. Naga37s-1]|nr:unnamed protein product [Closterium sp. Naga37s-1]